MRVRGERCLEARDIGGNGGIVRTCGKGRLGARSEELFGQRAAEKMVHPRHGIAHGHRHERVAMVTTAQCKQPLAVKIAL